MNDLIPRDCHDCGAKPGEIHKEGCDTERCSACGHQRIQCECLEHDPYFARWSGFWPGELESKALGIDLNTFYSNEMYKHFFIKPKLDDVRIEEIHGKDGVLDIKMKHPLFCLMTCEIMKFFKEQGGINYVTLDVSGPDGVYQLIVQKKNGKSPAEKQDELQEEIKKLHKVIESMEEDLDSNAHR